MIVKLDSGFKLCNFLSNLAKYWYFLLSFTILLSQIRSTGVYYLSHNPKAVGSSTAAADRENGRNNNVLENKTFLKIAKISFDFSILS
jgi:hypothetical protein